MENQLDKIVNYIKLRGGNVGIVVQQPPLKVKILIIIVIIQQKNAVPAQFFDRTFRVLFFIFENSSKGKFANQEIRNANNVPFLFFVYLLKIKKPIYFQLKIK